MNCAEDRLLRLPEVLKRIPVSRARWYRGIERGEYPKPVSLGRRAVAWRESDIDDIVQNGIAQVG